jgi:hypothetical protein
MTRTGRAITQIGLVAGILGPLVAAACAPKVARRQTDVMEKSGQVGVSAAELRVHVNLLADRFADQLEEMADRASAETRDRGVKRRALAFKVDAIPAVYSAAYRADPLAGAVDAWGFAYQLVQYLEEGGGQDAFGSGQALARETARELRAEADRVIESVVARPEHFSRGRVTIGNWAARNPIRHTFAARPNALGFPAQWKAEGRDAFVAVGAASETLESLSERLNTYGALLPKVARWQAELLISDETGEHDVQAVLADVDALGAVARRANELLDDVPGLVSGTASPVRALLAAERQIVLDAVNGQRRETLAFVTAERLAVLAAVREERLATVAALRQERIETLQEVDVIKTRAVDSAVTGLRDVVDHALLRLAALCVALMICATAFGVIGYRLTLGRLR